MLLAIDVGTTKIELALFRGEEITDSWRVHTDRNRTADEHGALFVSLMNRAGVSATNLVGVAIASVVPAIEPALRQMAPAYLGREAELVKADLWPSMAIRYHPPEAAGADRLMNALAALRLHGAPAIVADLGTATTFDVVSPEGEYLGGLILPGLGIALAALVERAPQLPIVELTRPKRLVGTSTLESLQSGVYYGGLSQIEGIVRRLRRQLGKGTTVVATGGLAPALALESGLFDHVHPHLTLSGLRIAWNEKHCGR